MEVRILTIIPKGIYVVKPIYYNTWHIIYIWLITLFFRETLSCSILTMITKHGIIQLGVHNIYNLLARQQIFLISLLFVFLHITPNARKDGVLLHTCVATYLTTFEYFMSTWHCVDINLWVPLVQPPLGETCLFSLVLKGNELKQCLNHWGRCDLLNSIKGPHRFLLSPSTSITSIVKCAEWWCRHVYPLYIAEHPQHLNLYYKWNYIGINHINFYLCIPFLFMY